MSVKADEGWGLLYFLATVGAAVYFIQQSSGFWGFVFAIFKAFVWPAYLVYHGLRVVGA